jgi:hypothetical protein
MIMAPKHIKILFLAAVFSCIFVAPSVLRAQCDQPDAPDCACFVDNSTWDAGGPSYPGTLFIQDVAADVADDTATGRIGVEESCACPGTWGCTWDPDPASDTDFKNSGKPYYQMILGQNTRSGALWMAELMATTDIEFHDRTEWCSETISYWHRETAVPNLYGYRNDWHEDWMVDTVDDLRFWYEEEERLDGRGRWIDSTELDYEDFQPGINAPLPGAYVAIAWFSYGPSRWRDHKWSHSLMVNEMTVHRDLFGAIYQVEVSLQEGNSRDRIRNDRTWPDILSLTPQGSQWVPNVGAGDDGIMGTSDDITRKIWGFGIDLDEHGDPIYDPARLHEVVDPVIASIPRTASISATDSDWDKTSQVLGTLTSYASLLRQNGGPTLIMGGQSRPIPDGQTSNEARFEAEFSGEVLIDLKGAHPLSIEGIELVWGAGYLPRNYTVEFFTGNQQSSLGSMPVLANIVPPSGEATPVPVRLENPLQGMQSVRLFFPDPIPEEAVLHEVRFLYKSSPWQDAPGESVSVGIPVFVDIKPGSCPNPLNRNSNGVVPVAVLGLASFDVKSIDPSSITLGGVSPIRWAYEDVATPFIGSPEECNSKSGDGKLDLTLKFDAKALQNALGLASKAGKILPVMLEGQLKDEYNATPIQGQDWIKVPGK